MVKAVINIKEESNRILNIIKAKYGLKDKSSAIDKICEEYAKKILENGMKPEKKEVNLNKDQDNSSTEKMKVNYVG